MMKFISTKKIHIFFSISVCLPGRLQGSSVSPSSYPSQSPQGNSNDTNERNHFPFPNQN